MRVVIVGSSGFIGQYLLQRFSEAEGMSLRTGEWHNQMEDISVLINLVGKAHDHKGTATEQDYYHANLELAKQVFQVFLKSSATLLIHISSLAALEEFESSDPLKESDECK